MNKRFNRVRRDSAKQCDKCRATIAFAKNREGKWLCVDVSVVNGDLVWVRSGASNNYINTHKCTNAVAAQPILLAAACVHKLQKAFNNELLASLGNYPAFEPRANRWTRVLELARKRVQRRFERAGLTLRDLERNLTLADALRTAGIKEPTQ